MLRTTVRLLILVTLVALIASACGGGYSPNRIPDGGPPPSALLDEIEERGGILHIEARQFTRWELLDSHERGRGDYRLPEHVVNDIWLLFREDGTGEMVTLTRGEGGEFISRFGRVDGEYISEHLPSGTVSRLGENTGSLAASPDVLAAYRDALRQNAEGYRRKVANGGTVEPSGADSTVVLVFPRPARCLRGMGSEAPVGDIEERLEVFDPDYSPVYRTCVLTTPDGEEILVNEDVARWERLSADRWDDIVSFVFGG